MHLFLDVSPLGNIDTQINAETGMPPTDVALNARIESELYEFKHIPYPPYLL